jgi:outer membrane protein TolC
LLAAAATGDAAFAADYPSALPANRAAMTALENTPSVRAARAMVEMERANGGRLVAGQYEWALKAGAQQRRENTGIRYQENELAVERQFRWFGKQDSDSRIARAGLLTAEAALADAWHEQARALMKSWFDWLREERVAAQLANQLALSEQLADVVQKRVGAGDVPKLDQLVAEGEVNKLVALLAQAREKARLSKSELARRYPAIKLADEVLIPVPSAPTGSAAQRELKILSDNHEVELADFEASLAKLRAQRSLLDRMPDPTISFHAATERDRADTIFGMTLTIPLPGAARRYQGEALQAQSMVMEEKARAVRERVGGDAARVAQQVDSVYQLWSSLDKISRQAARTAEAVGRGYRLGEGNMSEVLMVRRQALDSALSAAMAQIDSLEAAARLLLDGHELWAFEDGHIASGSHLDPP